MKRSNGLKKEIARIEQLINTNKMHLEINGYFEEDHIMDTMDALYLGRIDALGIAIAILNHKYPYLENYKG